MADQESFTNGAPYLLTEVERLASGQVRYHYLLPSGQRESIAVSQSVDNEGLRDRIGMMFAAGGRVVRSTVGARGA